MSYILVRRERTFAGNKTEFKVVDKLNPVSDKAYIQNLKIPSLGICFSCFHGDDPKDLLDNPILYSLLIRMLR